MMILEEMTASTTTTEKRSASNFMFYTDTAHVHDVLFIIDSIIYTVSYSKLVC